MQAMIVTDLETMNYRDAWQRQEAAHAQVLAGGEEQLLLVEHPPVITLGRREGVIRNLIASAESLDMLGVELVQSDRGGDITFHGPGQLVAYPIVRLNDHRLSVGGYVRSLENAIIAALAPHGIRARRDEGAVGVWAETGDGSIAKIGAIGVRIRRGISLHGVAVNVSTDLRYFELIVPCGLTGRAVTSVEKLLGANAPSLSHVRDDLVRELVDTFAQTRLTVGG
jgi:lipoate-protein ligase B